MMARTLRTTVASMAIVVLLSAVAVPSVWAKGRPTRAEFTEVACGSATVSTTWWKKLDVHVIEVRIGTGLSWASSTSGLTSPQTVSLGLLNVSWPSVTYTAVVTLYDETYTLLSTATATATPYCGL